MSNRCRVLLADDHALVRAGIRALLESMPLVEVVGETGDGQDALERVRRDPPDILLLDVSLPGLNGMEVAERIVRMQLPSRVLMLSMHSGPEFVARALAAGAAGYLIKDAAFDELAAAITAVARGGRYLSRDIDQDVVRSFEKQAAQGRSELEVLTPRQRQVLQLIAEGRGTRDIAERLNLSVKTVETHRAQLMNRLGIRDVPGLIRFAIRVGLLQPDS
ncbi:MAG TPA: response regulator transcription factor [Steroidobacteraceae bacterium]|nr:response regulator transcription factor [Steroidobacteraceae bacterium]